MAWDRTGNVDTCLWSRDMQEYLNVKERGLPKGIILKCNGSKWCTGLGFLATNRRWPQKEWPWKQCCLAFHFIFVFGLTCTERKRATTRKSQQEENENLTSEPDKAEAAHEDKTPGRKAERPQQLRQCDGCGETFTLLRDLKKHKCTVITLPFWQNPHWVPFKNKSG